MHGYEEDDNQLDQQDCQCMGSSGVCASVRMRVLLVLVRVAGYCMVPPGTDMTTKGDTPKKLNLSLPNFVVHVVVIALFQRSNTREARSTAKPKVLVKERQMMVISQTHQPRRSFVSLANRSSLGTRKSVPESAIPGNNSNIQNGNTDTTSMNNQPAESSMVVW